MDNKFAGGSAFPEGKVTRRSRDERGITKEPGGHSS